MKQNLIATTEKRIVMNASSFKVAEMHPALKRLLDQAECETREMIAATIASGQHTLIKGFETEHEAYGALPVGTCFQVTKNISGRFSHT